MSSHNDDSLTRRNFLAGSVSASALILSTSAQQVRAQEKASETKETAPTGPPVNCAVIGLGPQGRAILAALGRVPGANVAAICDTYPAYVKRSQEAAPRAAAVADYRQVLDKKEISSVFVATPTHQHKEIVLAAMAAGKNVYCEAPIAHTVEDARAIAAAGKKGPGVFQGGLQYRSNPQHEHVRKFVHGGSSLGDITQVRAQWHKKTNWRRTAPTDQRAAELNWRLRKASSAGLIGEEGIHSIDTMNWFLKAVPVSVTAQGQLMRYKDGREAPDTVQAIFEYPGGIRFVYDATITNSYDGTYETLQGVNAAVLVRGQQAWIFKEVDAELLGWEVYARKEEIFGQNGIVLVADATKILALGKIPGKDGSTLDPGKDALYYAVESFLNCVRATDPMEKVPAVGPLEALQATVTVLKANEAALGGTKIAYQKEWFTL